MQEELSQYISHARQTGASDDKIRDQLTSVGWNLADVQAALAISSRTPGGHEPALPAASQPMPERNPHETYFHITSLVTLYLLMVAVGSVLFQLINIWNPDPAESIWDSVWGKSYRQAVIRSGIASIIILLPLYLFHWLKLAAEVARDSARHASKIRARWLHVTIFFAVIVLMSDLIAFVVNIWSGELTGRPIWKIVTVFVLAGLVILYHAFLVRTDQKVVSGTGVAPFDSALMRGVFAGALVVGVGVVAGFGATQVKSPAIAAQERRDERRVQDLGSIASSLSSYSYDHDYQYPDTLSVLTTTSPRGSTTTKYLKKLPTDPSTRADYEYRVTADRGYELCANFETDQSDQEGSNYYYGATSDVSNHAKGRACQTREGQPVRMPYIE
ncbi:hypothetical protein HYW67_00660 [Candidatus Parcubacteria bacterium]|nr:hypothetical protein [Candidatus Parcubacteria bacterium]